MEINVSFSCPCGAFVEQNLHVSGPDYTAETVRDADEEYFESLQCDGCGKDFEARIRRRLGETRVSIAGAVSLSYDVLTESTEQELQWVIESTEHLDTFRDVARNVYRLLQVPVPEDLKMTLHNMLYAQVVTAVEAYLSGTFIHTVVNSELLIRKLVESDPDFGKRPLTFKDIFRQWDGLMGFVPDFRTALLASRGISQATNPDAITKTN